MGSFHIRGTPFLNDRSLMGGIHATETRRGGTGWITSVTSPNSRRGSSRGSHIPMHQNYLEGLFKQMAGFYPQGSPDPVYLGWNLRTCVSKKIPGHTDVAGLGATSEIHSTRRND